MSGNSVGSPDQGIEGSKDDLHEDEEELEEGKGQDEVGERTPFGVFTSMGTFVASGDYHPDPVRAMVGAVAEDMESMREQLLSNAEDLASLRDEVSALGRLIAGIHEILVRMDKASK